jgi:serine O-acetyltransferase
MLNVLASFLPRVVTALGRKPQQGELIPQGKSPSTQLWRFPLRSGLQDLKADFSIIRDRDPAARNRLEILCCYPGLHALAVYRFSHWLNLQNIAFLPRFLSHLTRFFTGIEIHPGAVIGKGVFIDHGMGVVIGETAIVGDDVVIYQGATLGGTGKESGKRHPTLGDRVIVGAGAKILGNIAIGNDVRVGAGSIVLKDVPTACTVVGVPGRNICRKPDELCLLDREPDTEAEVIRTLLVRIERLEQDIQRLSAAQSPRAEIDPTVKLFERLTAEQHEPFPSTSRILSLSR